MHHTGLSSEVGRTFRAGKTELLYCRIRTLYCFVAKQYYIFCTGWKFLFSLFFNVHRFFEMFFYLIFSEIDVGCLKISNLTYVDYFLLVADS